MNRMLSAALVAATMASVSIYTAAGAQAGIVCGSPVQMIGATGTNPVVQTVVWHDGPDSAPVWHVIHKLQDGTIIDRTTQYGMSDASNGAWHGWRGWSTKNPKLWMTGGVFVGGSRITYTEELHDAAHGNAVIMHSDTNCQIDPPAPASAPPVVASTPAPVVVGQSAVIALVSSDGGFSETVPVAMGGQTVMMTIDTGAMFGVITTSVADALIASGEATEAQAGTAVMANGQTVPERRVTIKQISLGGRTVNNVLTGVGPDNGMSLLGMNVLKKFGRFTIDTATDHLILG